MSKVFTKLNQVKQCGINRREISGKVSEPN